MSTLLLVAIVLGVIVVGVLIIGLVAWGFERDVTSGEPRPTSGPSAGMFGGLTEIFDPAAHRAQLEREQQRHATTIAPTPSGDDTDRSRMTTDARGNPVSFVPRRRSGPPAAEASSPVSPDTPGTADRADPAG